VNGITTFMSGTPFTVYDSAGVSLQGGAPEISGFPSDRPTSSAISQKAPASPTRMVRSSSREQLTAGSVRVDFSD